MKFKIWKHIDYKIQTYSSRILIDSSRSPNHATQIENNKQPPRHTFPTNTSKNTQKAGVAKLPLSLSSRARCETSTTLDHQPSTPLRTHLDTRISTGGPRGPGTEARRSKRLRRDSPGFAGIRAILPEEDREFAGSKTAVRQCMARGRRRRGPVVRVRRPALDWPGPAWRTGARWGPHPRGLRPIPPPGVRNVYKGRSGSWTPLRRGRDVRYALRAYRLKVFGFGFWDFFLNKIEDLLNCDWLLYFINLFKFFLELTKNFM